MDDAKKEEKKNPQAPHQASEIVEILRMEKVSPTG
jgi:hypothetical protein